MKYLGIDYGLKKIGVATGDDASRMAFPLMVIPGGDEAAMRIVALARREGADGFVVGVPLPTAEHHSDEQLRLTLEFVAALEEASGVSVALVDEQFSSAEARRLQKEYGVEGEEDAVAAAIVLQAFLDEIQDSRYKTQEGAEPT